MTNEEEVKKMMGDMLLKALNEKEAIISEFVKIMMTSDKTTEGLKKFITAIDEGKTSNEQMIQMFRTLVKVNIEHSMAIKQIAFAMQLYVAGESFDNDANKILTKIGRGVDALKSMFKNRFGNANPFKK